MWTTFTGRELEFLATLRESWERLYQNELVRLMKEDAERSGRSDRDDASKNANGWPRR